MQRIGTILTFKPEVSKAEAAMALNGIRHLLDVPSEVAEAIPAVRAAIDAGETIRFRSSEWSQRPFKMIDKINEFDDDWGGPVWYIP